LAIVLVNLSIQHQKLFSGGGVFRIKKITTIENNRLDRVQDLINIQNDVDFVNDNPIEEIIK